MNIMDLIRSRHSVRQYLNKPIPQELREQMEAYTEALNLDGNLHIQIMFDEPECFDSRMAHYGKFENVSNYISLIGKREKGVEERCGFFGEKLVLKAQELGLNTCWVALTHGKSKAIVRKNEKEVIIIALGYGKTQGIPHKSKDTADVCNMDRDAPDWYRQGIEAALLAPTAINQQKFRFERKGNCITVRSGMIGPCLRIDLGIVKCHFELAAGKENFIWA